MHVNRMPFSLLDEEYVCCVQFTVYTKHGVLSFQFHWNSARNNSMTPTIIPYAVYAMVAMGAVPSKT